MMEILLNGKSVNNCGTIVIVANTVLPAMIIGRIRLHQRMVSFNILLIASKIFSKFNSQAMSKTVT